MGIEPSYNQTNLIYKYFSWIMPIEKAQEAVQWIQKTTTKDELIGEIHRLKRLHDKHLLSLDNCFDSRIWEGFKHE